MQVNGTNNRGKPFSNQMQAGHNIMGMIQHMYNMGGQSSDLTFFDSKMLTAKAGTQRASNTRPQIGGG